MQVTAYIHTSSSHFPWIMQPKKKQCITKSTSQSSSPMAHYLSSSSSSSAPRPTSSLINLTSSPSPISPSTTSTSISQRGDGRTSYIWNHGKKIIRDGKDRWECNHCGRSYAITSSSTTNQRDHLNDEHSIPDPKAPVDTKQSTLDNYRRPPILLDVLRKLIVEWIVERRHSFNETESEALRKIFEYLNCEGLVTTRTRRISMNFSEVSLGHAQVAQDRGQDLRELTSLIVHTGFKAS